MSEFQRSPSKVWWADEYHNWPRTSSTSPGSQDSGFSDTETSPAASHKPSDKGEAPKRQGSIQRVPKDILKEISEEDAVNAQNLSVNFKQKSSPKKSIALKLSETADNVLLFTRTPKKTLNNPKVQSEPAKKHRFYRNGSLKVSRSLFKHLSRKPAEDMPVTSYQYAEDNNDGVESQYSNTSSKVILDDSQLWKSDDSIVELQEGVKASSLRDDSSYSLQRNRSAPDIFSSREDQINVSLTNEESFHSSESDSELESVFHGVHEHPKHTSTPKATSRNFRNMRHHRNKRLARLLSLQNNSRERIPLVNFNGEPPVVQRWLQEARELYESECTTALQCKSIALELAQKVAFLATRVTSSLRKLLADSEVITVEFNNIESQKQHTGPLAQSLARLVEEFIKNYDTNDEDNVLKICEKIRCSHSEDIAQLISKLNSTWEIAQQEILVKEIKSLVNKLEDPQSDLHVRAALTGLTSIALRNKDIVKKIIACNVVQVLCVLGEKCESSTIRSLVLRALSTVCINNTAVRQFESAAGVQLINEIISEETRPEPERSEAVALLAQITAPWIEDNHCICGLQEHVKAIVKALTYFISSTKCCQNLLLCTAALANLTEMEPKSIKYILHQNSIGIILKVIRLRDTLVSIYLLEQVATLIANLSAKTQARKALTREQAPAAILHFLQCHHTDEDIERRLQQKSVIALSRLSGDHQAAEQIVKCDGVNKLVVLCRERKARHDSDAVLVAALATLRKIAEACGSAAIDSQDVQELVEPRLLDSFLAYSTQNESYV